MVKTKKQVKVEVEVEVEVEEKKGLQDRMTARPQDNETT
jgi:hypothetical protein